MHIAKASLLFGAACGFLLVSPLQAQKAGKSSGTEASASSPSEEPPSPPGFSIESEMLTYTSLQRDSEAIACDILRYLNHAPAARSDAMPQESCEIAPGQQVNGGVVILTANSKALSDFELWRTDMAVMYSLKQRGADFTPQGSSTTGGTAAAARLLDLSPYGAAISMAQNLLSTTESTSPVRGTVEDQAFVDAIARQLRARGVSVLAPDTYVPLSLTLEDNNRSLYLSKLQDVDHVRDILVGGLNESALAGNKSETNWSPSDIAKAQELLADIRAFTATVFGGDAGMLAENPQHTSGDSTTNQKTTMTLAPYASSHLVSVLSADLLAQELGIDADEPDPSAQAKNARWQHILWLQPLESGGSVIKAQNFLRSKIRYSGGVVSTYALFNLSGELECSGNVFDYGGPILAKDFQGQIPHGDFDPRKEILLEGGCQSLQTPSDH